MADRNVRPPLPSKIVPELHSVNGYAAAKLFGLAERLVVPVSLSVVVALALAPTFCDAGYVGAMGLVMRVITARRELSAAPRAGGCSSTSCHMGLPL